VLRDAIQVLRDALPIQCDAIEVLCIAETYEDVGDNTHTACLFPSETHTHTHTHTHIHETNHRNRNGNMCVIRFDLCLRSAVVPIIAEIGTFQCYMML
jgi:hypothetical protein